MKKLLISLLGLAALAASCGTAKADDGLLVDYSFREGAGNVVHDSSGNGNDGTIQGGATWVKGLPFGALSFNGKDSYVEGPKADFPIGPTGTLELWCYPRKFGGGLISWNVDGDQRLSLKYDVFWCNRLEGNLGNGTLSNSIEGDDMPADVMNRWSHMVLRFDANRIEYFRNGKLQVSKPAFFTPDIKGAVMRVGATEYLRGLPYFDGMLAGVKVYNRSLSDSEIAAHFAQGAPLFHPYLPRLLKVVPRYQPARHELVAAVDLGGLADRSLDGYSLQAQMFLGPKLLQTVTAKLAGTPGSANLTFDANHLAVAEYEIRCKLVSDSVGVSIAAASVRWRLPKLGRPGSNVLNNLVAELLDFKNVAARPSAKLAFNNPRQGWVFVACKSRLTAGDTVHIGIDGDTSGAAIDIGAGTPSPGETMCYLPEGAGALDVQTNGTPAIDEIIVRAIPELMACGYPASDSPEGKVNRRGMGDYDYDFLSKGLLPNLNTLVAGYGAVTIAREVGHSATYSRAWFDHWNQYGRWKHMGRRWVQEMNLPNLRGGPDWINANSHYDSKNPVTADQVFDFWVRNEGFTDPNYSGLIADELSTQQGFNVPKEAAPYVDSRYLLPPYTGAIKRMMGDPRVKDRCLYIWAGANGRALSPDTSEFVKTVMNAGYKFAWEEYMSQPPTVQAGREILYTGPSGWAINSPRLKMENANALFPGMAESLLFAPGIYSAPGISHIVDPSLDYKVWMDMEMRYLATAPEFFGLDGVILYPIYSADEESLRWSGRLFRHYAIEGKTDLLSPSYGFTWKPGIIQNADFDEGLEGWTVAAAEPGSVAVGELDNLGMLEGRMRRDDCGRHFLLTRRVASGPNSVSQVMRNLVPGKVYSVKMLSDDYQCYLKGVEGPELSAHLSIDGVEMIPAKSFVTRYRDQGGKTEWFDSFRLVFRARATTAKLTISDWKADGIPGGPVGQQLLFNYVAVTPYFE